ncbi:PHP domain-containing protein [Leptolyngbya sp. 7M]|uniref:PHP domain-containing protein n=1 Tax=Leptolyngbya sp. 7M TaxID=2812896 RepID=UPI001B8B6E46|nr:PHP domain-containing protein [Leptolyngbya sp. 7M]QYO63007.1 PHP domain-containing protein [Leptolyngbya sp. 7M]
MAVNLAGSRASCGAPDAAALRSVFETITVESCPRSFNFHMHTVCSDGRLQPEQLIHQAVEIGLQGLAITDHHSVNGYLRARQWLADQQQTQPERVIPQLWTGTEINAGLLSDEVHILAYAFDLDHAAIQPYLQGTTPTGKSYQAAQVIGAIQQAGGLAVLAHPARYRRSPQELIPAAVDLGIDGVETYYAYNNPSPWRPSPKETEAVGSLGDRYSLLHTCGTDTHGLSLLQRL